MSLAGPPIYEAFAVAETQAEQKKIPKLVCNFNWLQWFGSLTSRADSAPERKTHVRAVAQVASIALTPLPLGSVPAGIYRVTYNFRVTTPGSVSSSLQFTLTWTDGGVVQTSSGAAETGNTTTTKQMGTMPIRSDGGVPISYSTTYGDGGGAVAMAYRLDIVLEALALDTA